MVARTRHLPASSGMRFSRPEDVPEDLALAMAANLEGEFVKDQGMLVHLYSMLPWLAPRPSNSCRGRPPAGPSPTWWW